jgi:segregation and condensation protein A
METDSSAEFVQQELIPSVKLPAFEGPLDLLLHLIKKNEFDIYNVPIALIAQQYLEYLEIMKSLNLDIAGEFLLMAATLVHIKSKKLLPQVEDEEETDEDEDEKNLEEELRRRLLEYQRFKEIANQLGSRPLLDRDVYAGRLFTEQTLEEVEEALTGEVTLFDLLEAMKKVLQGAAPEDFQEISLDHLSVRDKIVQIMDRLWERESVAFTELFTAGAPRLEIVITFLGLLELLRLRMVKIFQAEPFGPIRLFSPVEPEEGRKTIEERIQ